MKKKTRTNLLVDILIFVVFLIVYEEKSTGTAIHEWLGVMLGLFFIVHIILHWKWLVVNTKLFLDRMRTESRINYILDMLIFIGFTTVIFTGIMGSESFLPTFGISTVRGHYWQGIHHLSVNITLFMVAIHFALHWRWIADNFKRYIISPLRGKANNNKPAKMVAGETLNSASGFFSSLVKVSFQLIVILALSGLISVGWYAASGTIPPESQRQELSQRSEGNLESGIHNENNRGRGRFESGHRGRQSENGHHSEKGFFGIELLKNLLIFTIITLILTRIAAVIKNRKKLKLPIQSRIL